MLLLHSAVTELQRTDIFRWFKNLTKVQISHMHHSDHTNNNVQIRQLAIQEVSKDETKKSLILPQAIF